MGLAQKRILQEFQETEFPKWKAEIEKAAGTDIPMEVKWDTMQNEEYTDRNAYFQWYEAVYFRPLVAVFQQLCVDNMGKEAVKAGVKQIVIDGTEGSQPGSSKFENGVFTLRHKFNTNVDAEKDRVDGWRKMIESKL